MMLVSIILWLESVRILQSFSLKGRRYFYFAAFLLSCGDMSFINSCESIRSWWQNIIDEPHFWLVDMFVFMIVLSEANLGSVLISFG